MSWTIRQGTLCLRRARGRRFHTGPDGDFISPLGLQACVALPSSMGYYKRTRRPGWAFRATCHPSTLGSRGRHDLERTIAMRARLRFSSLLRFVSLCVFLALVATPMTASGASSPVSATASSVPAFSHIYVIVMENHEYGSIVGNTHAPFINALIRRYGLATNYTAVAHPSEPNYLALWAGSTFGIRDDSVHNIAGRNVADQLAAHGRSWHVYAQDLPRICSTVSAAYGGVDLVGAAGWYARKHEPAINFTDISGNWSRCSRITRLSSFSPTAASLELIVPNMTNDMHDGTIAQGDGFLHAFVPRITGSSAFPSSLLVI